MQNMLENQIRERAYHLWVADGCREGEADRHWLVAEREFLALSANTVAAPEAPVEKRRPRALAAKAPGSDAKPTAPKMARRRAS
jgi:Protein of unknown function (DUF2934)